MDQDNIQTLNFDIKENGKDYLVMSSNVSIETIFLTSSQQISVDSPSKQSNDSNLKRKASIYTPDKKPRRIKVTYDPKKVINEIKELQQKVDKLNKEVQSQDSEEYKNKRQAVTKQMQQEIQDLTNLTNKWNGASKDSLRDLHKILKEKDNENLKLADLLKAFDAQYDLLGFNEDDDDFAD